MDSEKSKFQYEGMKWIMELQLLNQPQAINTIKFNILMASPRIKEVELLIYRENQTMLVLLDLTWFGRKFQKKQIFSDVQDALSQLLPSFRFRVTDDPNIMTLAVERVQKALTGGLNENTSGDLPSNFSVSVKGINDSDTPEKDASIGSTESPDSGKEEPSEVGEQVRGEVIKDNSSKE